MNELHPPPDLFFEMQQAAEPGWYGSGFLPMRIVAILQRLGNKRPLKAAAGLMDAEVGCLTKSEMTGTNIQPRV
jgi:hypothetical protein